MATQNILITFTDLSQKQPSKIPNYPFSYVFFVSKKHQVFAFLTFLGVTLGCILMTGNNYAFKKIIDSIGNQNDLWQWSIIYASIYLLGTLCWRSSGFTGMRWIVRSTTDSYTLLFSYLINHSSNYFDNRFAGAITNKVSNASEGVRRMMAVLSWNLYPVIVRILASFILAYIVNFQFSVILIAWTIIFVCFNIFTVSKRKKYSIAYSNSVSALKGQMVDIATNIKTVNQYARNSHELSRLDKYIQDRTDANLKNWSMSELMLIINNFLQFFFVLIMLALALWLNKNAGLGIGDTIMILTLSTSLMDQLLWIGSNLNELMDHYGEVKEGLSEILIDHELKDQENAYDMTITNAAINFENINFKHGKKSIFKNFNLKIKSGQKIGLVGESGAGKSTLISLLLRQHDLNSGAILINQHNIATVTQASLRTSIAIVPQEPMLFHRSILENIRYGKLAASDEQVMQAAELAQAHNFILELPNGYQTTVGERGVKLSGGQRQRVAIARAILKDAPILILDEATSSLDSQSEGEIQKALQNLMKNKTVIAIAHRLSTIKAMDRTIVIEKGQIIQDGPHEQLVKDQNGLYQQLWHKQSEGFI